MAGRHEVGIRRCGELHAAGNLVAGRLTNAWFMNACDVEGRRASWPRDARRVGVVTVKLWPRLSVAAQR
jgi:hypothetical protein